MSARTETGTILIADLSGYTEYLVRAEIEQASAIVADLIGRVATAIGSSFVVNRVEGDAVLAWAGDGSVDAIGLLDTIDGTYADFRHRAVAVHQATACPCEACGLLPNLDLKLVAHHGTFVRHTIAGREELSGKDVIVAHRLLKNSLGFSGPDSGYALLTEACVRALGIDPSAEGMRPHREAYEHIGDVDAWVVELGSRWSDTARWEPTGSPVAETTATFPAPLPLVWAALARGDGDSCVVSRLDELTEVVEWRPYRRFVLRGWHRDAEAVREAAFEPAGEGTTVSLRWYAETPDAAAREAIGRDLEEHTADHLASVRAAIGEAPPPIA